MKIQPRWACQKPLTHAGQTLAVQVRRVGIAGGVAELVVPAVLRHPGQQRALDGHRAEAGQDELDHWIGLERAVGKQPMKADRDPHGREEVLPEQEPEIHPAEAPAPQGHAHGHQAQKRQDDPGEVCDQHAGRKACERRPGLA